MYHPFRCVVFLYVTISYVAASSSLIPSEPWTYKASTSDKSFYAQFKDYLPTLTSSSAIYKFHKSVDKSKDLEIFLPMSYYNSTDDMHGMNSACKKRWKKEEKKWKHSYYFTILSKTFGQPLLSAYKVDISADTRSTMELKSGVSEGFLGPRPGRECGSKFAVCPFTGIDHNSYEHQATLCCGKKHDCSKAVSGSNPSDLYDKGHQVPNRVMHVYNADPQTYSFCNIGAQTNQLNEQKWEFLESFIDCCVTNGSDDIVESKKTLHVFAGPLPPFGKSAADCLAQTIPWPDAVNPNHVVPKGWWKIVWDGTQTYVWTFKNNFVGEWDPKSFSGKKGLEEIEDKTGFEFPKMLKETFADSVKDLGCPAKCSNVIDP
eukprot:g1504.t1